mmetsp:Transcript_11920/g.22855  ORF Transcript_11920/g.22855 Transcript_11920/m.22855 type:complete len:687 (+) Transcript_11920:2060-4120(+)
MAKVVCDETIEESGNIIGSPEDMVWRGQAHELAGDHISLRDLPEHKHVHGILFPDDVFVKLWQITVALLLLYTATVTIFRIAFIDYEDDSWSISDTVIDGLFFFDVVVNCFLAYYDSEMNLVTSRVKIFVNYLRTWMILDIVSCLPFQYLLGTNSNYNKVLRVARLPRLYKLIKVTKMMRMLKIFKDRSKLHSYVRGIIQVNIGVKRLVSMLATFLLLIHLIACFWVLIGKLDDTYDNWIFKYNFVDAEMSELYVAAFYWALTTLATVGYGDITAVNSGERIMCSLVMLIGIFLYSYVISSITSLIGNLDNRKTKLTKKMRLLNEIARQFKISKLFYKKLSKAIEYENSRTLGLELTHLIEGLPSKLRSELLYVIHKKMIESNTFFEGKSLYFVAEVAELLKPQKADMNEIIYKEDEYAMDMYLIYKGEVGFCFMPEMIQYCTVSERYYFGEGDILISEKSRRTATVVSNAACDLFTIDKNRLNKLLDRYPETKIELLTLAKERMERNELEKQKSRQFYMKRSNVDRRVSMPQSLISRTKLVNLIVKKELCKAIEENDESNSDEEEFRPKNSKVSVDSTGRTQMDDNSEYKDESPSFRRPKNLSDINLQSLFSRGTTLSDKDITKQGSFIRLKRQVSKLEDNVNDLTRSQYLILDKLDHLISLQTPSYTQKENTPEESMEEDPIEY